MKFPEDVEGDAAVWGGHRLVGLVKHGHPGVKTDVL